MASVKGDPLARTLGELGTHESLLRRETGAYEAIAGEARRIVIVGGGQLGTIVLAAARRAGVEVVAVADNNPARWGTTLDGLPILSLADAVAAHNDDAVYVVAVYNGTPLRTQLHALGCKRVAPYLTFYWQFSRDMREEDRLELPHRIVAQAGDMGAGYACLSDVRSREEFAAQIGWRCSGDHHLLPAADPASSMYFARDVVRLSDDETLVDCGAYDGDSIRMFLDTTSGAFGGIYAFEPDAKNRTALQAYVSTLPGPDQARISILPFGLSDTNGAVAFDGAGTVGSRVSAAGGTEVIECRRLDDVLDGVPVTMIKMDIEGAEPEAIRGATATIRRTRPILAACAYHKCEHLWTLPVIMKAALPDYRILLRRYAEECWETVYYAVPPERVVGGVSG